MLLFVSEDSSIQAAQISCFKSKRFVNVNLWFENFHLRANFCKYRESGDSFKIFNFLIFCPNKAFSELFSKIQLKDPKALGVFSEPRKVWKSPFWPPAAIENWQKWCIFVSLVLVNAITSSNVLLTYHSTSLALSKTLDYFWKAVKVVLFLAVSVTPLEAHERRG